MRRILGMIGLLSALATSGCAYDAATDIAIFASMEGMALIIEETDDHNPYEEIGDQEDPAE